MLCRRQIHGWPTAVLCRRQIHGWPTAVMRLVYIFNALLRGIRKFEMAKERNYRRQGSVDRSFEISMTRHSVRIGL